MNVLAPSRLVFGVLTLGVVCPLGHAVAATRTVTTAADSGAGSLRQAVLDAGATGDTIVFSSALAGQTIVLSQDPQTSITQPTLNVAAPFGDTGIVVNGKTLTIDGANAPGLIISGGGVRRIFAVTGLGGSGLLPLATAGLLTLRNLTLANGFHKGGDGANGGGGAAGMGGPFSSMKERR